MLVEGVGAGHGPERLVGAEGLQADGAILPLVRAARRHLWQALQGGLAGGDHVDALAQMEIMPIARYPSGRHDTFKFQVNPLRSVVRAMLCTACPDDLICFSRFSTLFCLPFIRYPKVQLFSRGTVTLYMFFEPLHGLARLKKFNVSIAFSYY